MAIDEPNNQVMTLWRQQAELLASLPETISAQVEQTQDALRELHERANGNQEIIGHITTAWSCLQSIRTLVSGQTTALNSASIIIPALKVQRDELALELHKLLEELGHTSEEGSPIDGLLSSLYDSWRSTITDDEIVSVGQDELLEVIRAEIESRWGLAEGDGFILMGALRGHTDLTAKQEKAFMAFLKSMGGES
jgi:hypothetical protein